MNDLQNHQSFVDLSARKTFPGRLGRAGEATPHRSPRGGRSRRAAGQEAQTGRRGTCSPRKVDSLIFKILGLELCQNLKILLPQ